MSSSSDLPRSRAASADEPASRRGRAFWVFVVAYAYFGGTYATWSRPAMAVTAAVGVAAASQFLPAPATVPATARRFAPAGWWLWVALLLAVGGWEAWAFAIGSTHAHPTLSTLINSSMHGPTRRRVAWLLWLLGGAWLTGGRS